jgi:hypothetical protein
VGQSAVPEAVLARELGLCYALVAMVSSRAAGLQERKDSRDILDSIWSRADPLRGILSEVILRAATSEREGRCTSNAFEADQLFDRLHEDDVNPS